MGEVLYSTKWVKYSTHNNQHGPPPPYPPLLCPLYLHGNSRHSPGAWFRRSLWVQGRRAVSGLATRRLVRPFRGRNEATSKNREERGASALGGRHLAAKHNNQPIVGGSGGGIFRRARDLGGTCGGGTVPSFGAAN